VTSQGEADEHRDTVLDILSDARFTAPLIQMADYHAKSNPKSYLYVFKHNSQFGEFAQVQCPNSRYRGACLFYWLCRFVSHEYQVTKSNFRRSMVLLSSEATT